MLWLEKIAITKDETSDNTKNIDLKPAMKNGYSKYYGLKSKIKKRDIGLNQDINRHICNIKGLGFIDERKLQ